MNENRNRDNYAYFKTISTRWMDNDIYGHVNNVTYYSYFDTVANSYLIERAGLDIQSATSVGFVVASSCDYHAPIAFPQIIEAGFRVNELGSKSVQYGIAIFNDQQQQACASGIFTHVWVDRASGKSIAIPEQIRQALMGKILTRDTLASAVGDEIGVSDWYEITQENVNKFADVTSDHQFIHIDPEKAAQTPFGGTIAHGFYTVSMLSHFAGTGCGVTVEGMTMGVNYGCDKLRFIQPVRVGSRIRGRSVLTAAVEKKPGQFLFTSQMTVEIEGMDKPALIADWLTMVFV